MGHTHQELHGQQKADDQVDRSNIPGWRQAGDGDQYSPGDRDDRHGEPWPFAVTPVPTWKLEQRIAQRKGCHDPAPLDFRQLQVFHHGRTGNGQVAAQQVRHKTDKNQDGKNAPADVAGAGCRFIHGWTL